MKKVLLRIFRNMLDKYVFENDKLQADVVALANTKLDIPFISEKQEKEIFDSIYNRIEPAFRTVIMEYLGEEPTKEGDNSKK